MMEKENLRSSSLVTFSSCPMKFLLDKETPKEAWDKSLALGFGSAVHAYADTYSKTKNEDLAFLDAVLQYPFHVSPPKYNRSLANLVEACDALKSNGILDKKVITHNGEKMLEYKFNIKIKTPYERDYYLSGVIDAVMLIDGRITVVDYKSSSVDNNDIIEKWYNRPQFKLYSWVIKEIFNLDYPIIVKVVSVNCVGENTSVTEIDVPISEKNHKDYLVMLAMKIFMLEKQYKLNYFLREDSCFTYNRPCKYSSQCHRFMTVEQTVQAVIDERENYPKSTEQEQPVNLTLQMNLENIIKYIESK